MLPHVRLRPGGRGGLPEEALGDLGLRSTEPRVRRGRADQTIEVRLLDGVEVHHPEPRDARRGESERRVEPDAAETHHEHGPPGEVGVDLGPPTCHGPALATLRRWRRHQRVVPGHRQTLPDDPHVLGLRLGDRCTGPDVPVPSRPRPVPAGKSHADEREAGDLAD